MCLRTRPTASHRKSGSLKATVWHEVSLHRTRRWKYVRGILSHEFVFSEETPVLKEVVAVKVQPHDAGFGLYVEVRRAHTT